MKKSLALAAIALMLVSLIPIMPVYANPFEIYMVPSANNFDTDTVSPCYTWTITFYAKDVPTPGAFAFQFKVFFDSSFLEVTAAALPAPTDTEYLFYGLSTVRPSPSIGVGNVLVGDSILSGAAVSGAGPFKLGTVEFHITAAPGKYETLLSDLDIDNVDTYVLNEALSEIAGLTKTSGSVTYAWAAPAFNPHMAIVPDYVLFDQYTDVLTVPNGDFSVGVYIENLALGWALHNASFSVHYNTPDAILDLLAVTIDPAWAGPNTVGVVPGTIDIFVQGHPAPVGDVLVATIDFRVNSQGSNPPDSASLFSDIYFSDIILWDTVGTIPTEASEDGLVEVEPYLALPLPWFEVDSVTLGPELVVGDQFGQEFDVNVYIKNLHFAWMMVGFNMRLTYDPAIIEVVSVTEGPFLTDPTWNWYGTYPIVMYPEPANFVCPSTHMILADLLLPNGMGIWDQPEPEGEGIVFTIRFKPLVQSWTDTYTVDLDVYPIFPGAYMVDEAGSDIPVDEGAIVDGVVTILPIDPVGRRIDVWFVSPPNGGQGIGEPADLVLPQSEICLTAKVTYNWWPVQYKKVTFEVRDNHGVLWAILQDDTNDEGHAYVCFRMPWPCEGAEDLLGKWNITVSVTLADVVITDFVAYDYDYLIRIWKVTTDKAEYVHCEYVAVTIEFGTKAWLEQDVVLAVTITDELGVPIGVVLVEMTVGGSSYCIYKNYTATVELHILKFAYAGIATVHVSFLNALPTEGGEAVAQEVATTFYILPI